MRGMVLQGMVRCGRPRHGEARILTMTNLEVRWLMFDFCFLASFMKGAGDQEVPAHQRKEGVPRLMQTDRRRVGNADD
jgi:hypothetical protein